MTMQSSEGLLFSLSVVSNSFETPWTVARQISLSMEFPSQEHWSRLPSPYAADLPDPGIEPASVISSALVCGFFTTSATWEAFTYCNNLYQSLSFLLNQKTASVRGVLVLSSQYSECSIARVFVGFPNGSGVNNLLAQCRRRGVQSLGQNPLEKEMATHSSSCLENFMDWGAWRATVYGATE